MQLEKLMMLTMILELTKKFNEFVEDIEDKISSEHKSWSLTTSSKNIH